MRWPCTRASNQPADHYFPTCILLLKTEISSHGSVSALRQVPHTQSHLSKVQRRQQIFGRNSQRESSYLPNSPISIPASHKSTRTSCTPEGLPHLASFPWCFIRSCLNSSCYNKIPLTGCVA